MLDEEVSLLGRAAEPFCEPYGFIIPIYYTYSRMDFLSKHTRSEVMSKIRSANTKPEILVRKELHNLGYRYRLHRKDLPGKPDITLAKYKTAIFIHGCFWHSHGCDNFRKPKSNLTYWQPKLERNVERDLIHKRNLRKLGWKVITIWECELADINRVSKKLQLKLQKA